MWRRARSAWTVPSHPPPPHLDGSAADGRAQHARSVRGACCRRCASSLASTHFATSATAAAPRVRPLPRVDRPTVTHRCRDVSLLRATASSLGVVSWSLSLIVFGRSLTDACTLYSRRNLVDTLAKFHCPPADASKVLSMTTGCFNASAYDGDPGKWFNDEIDDEIAAVTDDQLEMYFNTTGPYSEYFGPEEWATDGLLLGEVRPAVAVRSAVGLECASLPCVRRRVGPARASLPRPSSSRPPFGEATGGSELCCLYESCASSSVRRRTRSVVALSSISSSSVGRHLVLCLVVVLVAVSRRAVVGGGRGLLRYPRERDGGTPALVPNAPRTRRDAKRPKATSQ